MKILFYINTIRHGGAERVIVNLAEQFSSHGHEVALATSYKSEGEYALSESVKRIVLTGKKSGNFLVRNFRLIRLLRKKVKEERPDVLVSFMAEPNFRALLACRGKKTKKLISVRNDPNKEYPTGLFRYLARHLYKKADGIVFQTADAKAWFPEKIQKKSTIIYNQVNESFYNTARCGERRGIIATGRLTSQKNHKMLIRAFSMIKDKTDENLVIYGEGNLRGELEALISELSLEGRVLLPGATDNVAEKLSSARLFVMSSDFEGMPNSLMEGMATGLPCICTDCPCGGPREIIEDGVSGILTPVADAEAFAAAMLSLLSDSERAEKMGRAARERAERFAPDVIIENWLSYIESI